LVQAAPCNSKSLSAVKEPDRKSGFTSWRQQKAWNFCCRCTDGVGMSRADGRLEIRSASSHAFSPPSITSPSTEILHFERQTRARRRSADCPALLKGVAHDLALSSVIWEAITTDCKGDIPEVAKLRQESAANLRGNTGGEQERINYSTYATRAWFVPRGAFRKVMGFVKKMLLNLPDGGTQADNFSQRAYQTRWYQGQGRLVLTRGAGLQLQIPTGILDR